MAKKLKDLAKLVQGDLIGDPNISIKGVAPVETAKEGDLTFALSPSNVDEADRTKAAAVVAPKRTKPKKPGILVNNPRLALARILEIFQTGKIVQKGVHKTAVAAKNVHIGKDASIGAFVTLEDGVAVGARTVISPGVFVGEGTTIGSDCIIYPNVSIYDGTVIGDRVILNAGVVIGVSGFGFAQDNGKHVKIPQIGKTIIEDDVEIYANSTVARGTMGDTVIRRGTKIDCLTHVAHNSDIGEDCAITSLIAFAGGVKIGNRVFIGGQAAVSNKVKVGDGTVIMAKSGVTKDFPPNSVISGFPARDHKKDLETQALLHRLPELFKKVAELEKGSKEKP
jgi:UDP-3-O-[3-hydroxymyristoyl] glucosamine N-acyltransferase